MADASSSVRLNANQRRHFEVLFARLEDSLSRVGALLDHHESAGQVLSIVDDDVPAGFRATAPPVLHHLRGEIATLSRVLGLRPRRTSRRRIIGATLTAEAVRVEDSLASQMRGYGQVDPSVIRHLDPKLEEIAQILNALAASVNDHTHTGTSE